MDDTFTRAMIIGTSIFITILIVSLVFAAFNQMSDTFLLVKDADVSIHGNFDDYIDVYHGKVVSGMGLLNTLKKFEDVEDSNVEITYPNKAAVQLEADLNGLTESEQLKDFMEKGTKFKGKKYKYEDRYDVTVSQNGVKYTIKFSKK